LIRLRREFAPVETRILRFDAARRFLKFDNGELSAEMPTNSVTGYLEKDKKGRWFLIVEPFHNYHTERERGMNLWESMTAEQIAEPAGLAAIPQERKGFYELRPEHLPITSLIPQWGLLQITGIDFSDAEHPSLTIQCKRLAEEKDGRAGN
jgi:hypothetical protein